MHRSSGGELITAYRWIRASSLRSDIVFAIGLLLVLMALFMTAATPWPVRLAAGAALTLPVAIRRTWPTIATTALGIALLLDAAATAILDAKAAFTMSTLFIPVIITLYSVVIHGTAQLARWLLWLSPVTTMGLAGLINLPALRRGDFSLMTGLIAWGIMAAAWLTVWAIAMSARQARQRVTLIAEQTRIIEREHQQRTELAMAAERERINADVSNVVRQALGRIAERTAHPGSNAPTPADQVESKVDTVAAALDEVASIAREALGQTRQLVGVLRSHSDGTEYRPSPTLADIADLRPRGDGWSVELNNAVPTTLSIPALTQTAVYRIVEGALAMLDSVPAGTVSILVKNSSSALQLNLVSQPSAPSWESVDTLTEWATALGGVLESRAQFNGARELIATLPILGDYS